MAKELKMLLTNVTTMIEQMVYLDKLHPSMNIYDDEFYEEVKSSIEKEGLLRPIIVTPMTVREWKMLMENNSEMLPPPNLPEEEVVLQIRCGNNRWYAAKELGYTAITVAKVSMQEANRACRGQQRETKGGMWKK